MYGVSKLRIASSSDFRDFTGKNCELFFSLIMRSLPFEQWTEVLIQSRTDWVNQTVQFVTQVTIQIRFGTSFVLHIHFDTWRFYFRVKYDSMQFIFVWQSKTVFRVLFDFYFYFCTTENKNRNNFEHWKVFGISLTIAISLTIIASICFFFFCVNWRLHPIESRVHATIKSNQQRNVVVFLTRLIERFPIRNWWMCIGTGC